MCWACKQTLSGPRAHTGSFCHPHSWPEAAVGQGTWRGVRSALTWLWGPATPMPQPLALSELGLLQGNACQMLRSALWKCQLLKVL